MTKQLLFARARELHALLKERINEANDIFHTIEKLQSDRQRLIAECATTEAKYDEVKLLIEAETGMMPTDDEIVNSDREAGDIAQGQDEEAENETPQADEETAENITEFEELPDLTDGESIG